MQFARYGFSMEIGNRIAQERERLGMSQTELADAAEVSRGLVGQWEGHKKKPWRENLRKVAVILGVSMEYLLKGGDRLPSWISTDDPKEIKLLAGFRRLNERQKERLSEFIDESVAVRNQIEKKRSPVKGEPVSG
jgi:transcriptional regulator with XRE-family HTH domain